MRLQRSAVQNPGMEERACPPSVRWRLLACALAAGLAAMSGRAVAADCTGALTKLSACTSVDGDVTIGSPGCERVLVDGGRDFFRFRQITVAKNGALCVRDSELAGTHLVVEVGEIIVHGTLEIGSKAAPIGSSNPANKVTIKFTGIALIPKVEEVAQACPDPEFRRGLQLCEGGVLRLFGNKGAPAENSRRLDDTGKVSWTYLSEPAGDPCRFGPNSGAGSPVRIENCAGIGIGGKTIKLAEKVDWQRGDWIVIATSSFSPFETEFAKIESIDATRTLLTLEEPLVYYHFGGADPGPPSPANFNAGQDKNWGVDERAEVGLISRNIELKGDVHDHFSTYGGETIFRKGFQEASIQGVEFSLLGKEKLGSYPVHFHMLGRLAPNQVLFNANTIHHSFNKCITVHSTENLTIQNNVCARAVGHLFYQEIGDEEDITFQYNLGLGATSHNFKVDERTDLRAKYWWPGDKMANWSVHRQRPLQYWAQAVSNHDGQTNPTHGSCREPEANGGLKPGTKPPCAPAKYFEPASGFWIVNPGTRLIGNSIGGCQGVGRAFWYVAPPSQGLPPQLDNLKFRPIGTFENNRAHSCYTGLDASNDNGVASEQLFPHLGGKPDGASVFNVVDGMTVTRMRDRGIWLRPSFWVVKNARLATNRHSVSLVTAGGVDGTAPGNWALLKDFVLVGISLNNVDRFGPCPYRNLFGPATGERRGCIDLGTINGYGADDIERGYPEPKNNFFGLMIYDGPGRYFHNRFVNFNRDISPYLTAADQAFLGWYSLTNKNPLAPDLPDGSFVYEGDAAIGWFNANQSSYPNTQATEGLEFVNVDFRHQIYTERVGIDAFQDGDKNTLILDRDGILTGMKVVGPDGKSPVGNIFPASLNNLPFNATYNSVDECLSTGEQNKLLEGRPTSLIAPGAIATLEFSALFPSRNGRYEQWLTFSKTTPDNYPNPAGGYVGPMTLHGRDGRGIWEPKVANGYGYSIRATSAYASGGNAPADAVGIPPVFSLGLTDAVMAFDPATHEVQPFGVRVAICFTDKNGRHPKPKSTSDLAKMFKIVRGYKSYGSPTHNAATLGKYWNEIKDCHNLDQQNPGNLKTCPAKGVAVDGQCPDGQKPVGQDCPTKEITLAPDGNWMNPDDDKWYYSESAGMLYFHLVQRVDNGRPGKAAANPSPTGDCDKDNPPAECPNASKVPENYYFCPAGGCIHYRVELNADALFRALHAGTVHMSRADPFGAPILSAGRFENGRAAGAGPAARKKQRPIA